MPLTATITGTRKTGHRRPSWFADLFDTYLGPWATDDAHFYVGGAVGIDSLTLSWLARNSSSRITVVVPGTIKQQPAEAWQAIERSRERIAEIVELGARELHTPAFHARNRYMVDHTQITLGFPLEGSEGSGSGTWQTLTYTASQVKPRLIVPV